MDIAFDAAENASNIAKHGVPLALGALIIQDSVGEVTDDRRDYGETRINVFGLISGRLFVCTYTERDNIIRIISVPKASRQEQRRWKQ